MRNIVVIEACSTSFGGGLTYLDEMLKNSINSNLNFEIICPEKIIHTLPKLENVKYLTHFFLNNGIILRLIFQIFLIKKYINTEADILLSLNGDYIGNFRPFVGVCQNMLLYETEKTSSMKRSERLKLKLLRFRQISSFNKSQGVIFLSQHASKIVLPFIKTRNFEIINFGVSPRFKNNKRFNKLKPQKLLYVSSIHTYKNQIHLVKAIELLINENINIELTLVGPILCNQYWKDLKKLINKINNSKECIKHYDFIDHAQIHHIYNINDIFVFPSTCENMPNILLEAMASKIPILSSNLSPMPEFLKKNAIYFDPDNVVSIKNKILYSLKNYDLLVENSKKAFEDIKGFTWTKNFNQTKEFLNKISNDF